MVSSITRQVEPEFDERTRNDILAAALHDQQVCAGCGLHDSVRNDPDAAFTFEEQVCPVCEAQDVYGRILSDRDDKATPKSDDAKSVLKPRDKRPSDGRHVFLRHLSAVELAEREATAPKHRRRDRA